MSLIFIVKNCRTQVRIIYLIHKKYWITYVESSNILSLNDVDGRAAPTNKRKACARRSCSLQSAKGGGGGGGELHHHRLQQLRYSVQQLHSPQLTKEQCVIGPQVGLGHGQVHGQWQSGARAASVPPPKPPSQLMRGRRGRLSLVSERVKLRVNCELELRRGTKNCAQVLCCLTFALPAAGSNEAP